MNIDRTRTRSVRGLHDDEGGAIAIMAAVLAAALVLSASLAVDVGRVAATSRDFQGAMDRAALDGVGTLRAEYEDGAALGEPLQSTVRSRVQQSLAENGFPEERLEEEVTVVIGHVADGSTCFTPLLPPTYGVCDVEDENNLEPNAIEIDAESFQSYVLALGADDGGRLIPKTAVAAADTIGSVSAASTTASLDTDVAEAVLSELGGGADLNLVGYRGLVDARVSLWRLASVLGVGTVEEIADVTIDVVGEDDEDGNPTSLMGAAIHVLDADGELVDAEVETFLRDLNANATGLGEILLGDILEIRTGSGSAADIGVDAFSLVSAALQLANKGHFIELDAAVDGLIEDSGLTIIEPPSIAVGPVRKTGEPETSVEGWQTVSRTSQVQLDLTFDLDSSLDDFPLLGDLLDTLVDTVIGGLLDFLGGSDDPEPGTLQVVLETGRGASAITSETTCVGDGSMTTLTQAGAAELDISSPGGLVTYDDDSLNLGTTFSLSESDAVEEEFVGPFPSDTKTLPESTSPSISLEVEEDLSGDLLVELDSDDELNVLSDLEGMLNGLLFEDDGAVTDVLGILGVSLGSVDVQAISVDCDGRRLLPLDTSME